MQEEKQRELELGEEEARQVQAGRRTRPYDDGIARRRVPQRYVPEDGPIRRRVDAVRE